MILLSCVLNELNEKGSFLKLEQEKSNWTRKRIIISFGLQITLELFVLRCSYLV